jgi:hypothetical protein
MSDTTHLKRFTTIKALAAYVSHKKRLGKSYDVDAVKAHARFLRVEVESPSTPLEYAFWNRVIDYENVLHEKVGRNVKAQYTRRALQRLSVKDFLTGLMRKGPTFSTRLLEEAGRTDASYETVIISFAECFDEDVVKTAEERLKLKNSVDPKSQSD